MFILNQILSAITAVMRNKFVLAYNYSPPTAFRRHHGDQAFSLADLASQSQYGFGRIHQFLKNQGGRKD